MLSDYIILPGLQGTEFAQSRSCIDTTVQITKYFAVQATVEINNVTLLEKF